MTGFVGGFVAALLLVAAIVCLIWALNELNDERRKTRELEIELARIKSNRETQSLDIK